MKKTLLALAAIIIALPTAAKAGEVGTGPNPYTDCGIGAALFTSPDYHWAAVLSNVIWDLGTTAVTSAVSSPETCSKSKVHTAALILETLPEMEKDVAMGEGEYVLALAETMGCSSTDGLAASMRQGYAGVVSDASYDAKNDIERATAMYNVARDAAATNSCTAVL
ncbi:MAG: DUF3015 domain-containing protein [Micavibrio sp.]|nr:DUF3015 domain-containing protein [Micavibrio sp.]